MVGRFGLSFLLFIVLCNVFAVYYVSLEHYIYYWDYGVYFGWYQNYSQLLWSNPVSAVSLLFSSIYQDNYTFVFAFLLGVFSPVFGLSRLGYVLAVTNLFFIPATYALLRAFEAFIPGELLPYLKRYPFIPLSCVFFIPQFFITIVRGYADVFGLLPLNIVYFLYFKLEPRFWDNKKLVFVGVLLAFSTIYRRYFLFWVFAFVAVMFLKELVTGIKSGAFPSLKAHISTLKAPFVGLVVLSILLVVSTPVVFRWFQPGFADNYAAMKFHDNYFTEFHQIQTKVGSLVFYLAALGFIISLTYRSSRGKAVFLLFQTFLIFIMFYRFQVFDRNHMLMLLTPFVFFLSLSCLHVLSTAKTTGLKWGFASFFSIVLILNFAIVFVDGSESTISPYTMYFSSDRYRPLVRNDLDEIKRLVIYLDENVDDDEKIYVLASSIVLSGDIMERACKTYAVEGQKCVKYLHTFNWDLRDGFPYHFFQADYVVIPVAKDLNNIESKHKIVILLHELFLNQNVLGVHYERLDGESNLKQGVKVHVYRRLDDIPDKTKNQVLNRFQMFFPDNPKFKSP
ncbi:MAG: hypothetical protein KKD39_00925 [Candidatus Altiarchaeota archaeon]|nr:hypothetical protein [Candidatus Altiarchaeota archaeon]